MLEFSRMVVGVFSDLEMNKMERDQQRQTKGKWNDIAHQQDDQKINVLIHWNWVSSYADVAEKLFAAMPIRAVLRCS